MEGHGSKTTHVSHTGRLTNGVLWSVQLGEGGGGGGEGHRRVMGEDGCLDKRQVCHCRHLLNHRGRQHTHQGEHVAAGWDGNKNYMYTCMYMMKLQTTA